MDATVSHAPFSSEALRRACRQLPPPGRRSLVVELDDPRHAALLVPFTETDEGLGVVVTRRTSTMRRHGDDWVFPGGSVDPGDASAAAGALREASEELGVPADRFELLGQLDTHGPIVTGYVIDVFVALVVPRTRWRPDPREVAEVATVPLRRLVAPGNAFRAPMDPVHAPDPARHRLRFKFDGTRELLHFAIRPGEHLWGMQADILAELLLHLDAGTGLIALPD
ncbi:MAG: CoA pyrophosphatase [Gammaproteobacteria bacterium]